MYRAFCGVMETRVDVGSHDETPRLDSPCLEPRNVEPALVGRQQGGLQPPPARGGDLGREALPASGVRS